MTTLAYLPVWALATWGTVQIVTQSKVFRGLAHGYPGRPGIFTATPAGEPFSSVSGFVGSLLTCAMCFGWWVGAYLHLTGKGLLDSHWLGLIGQSMTLQTMLSIANGFSSMVLDGAAASALCEFARVATNRLEYFPGKDGLALAWKARKLAGSFAVQRQAIVCLRHS